MFVWGVIGLVVVGGHLTSSWLKYKYPITLEIIQENVFWLYIGGICVALSSALLLGVVLSKVIDKSVVCSHQKGERCIWYEKHKAGTVSEKEDLLFSDIESLATDRRASQTVRRGRRRVNTYNVLVAKLHNGEEVILPFKRGEPTQSFNELVAFLDNSDAPDYVLKPFTPNPLRKVSWALIGVLLVGLLCMSLFL